MTRATKEELSSLARECESLIEAASFYDDVRMIAREVGFNAGTLAAFAAALRARAMEAGDE